MAIPLLASILADITNTLQPQEKNTGKMSTTSASIMADSILFMMYSLSSLHALGNQHTRK